MLYVDDALCVSKNPVAQLEELNNSFRLKPDSIQRPKIYFGAKLSKCILPNGSKDWGISASKYIQDLVSNAERRLNEIGMKLTVKTNAPIVKDY